MTVQTAHFINQGPMHPVFVKCVIHHTAVAPPAQLKSCPFGLQWIRRIRCLMALITQSIGHGHMNIIVKDPCPVRTVDIMAG